MHGHGFLNFITHFVIFEEKNHKMLDFKLSDIEKRELIIGYTHVSQHHKTSRERGREQHRGSSATAKCSGEIMSSSRRSRSRRGGEMVAAGKEMGIKGSGGG